MASSEAATNQPNGEYEEKNVHEVYQLIANHFSATRYKPWPIVERFLKELAPGAIGLDVGCGNGKYLSVNQDVFIVASDRNRFINESPLTVVARSENLARIAVKHQPHSTIVADILNLPHPDSFFDFALSIAVIHHLSTPDRRIQAIREILRTLRPSKPNAPGGKALLYVWALEQKSSRRGWDKGDQQDVMVPWVLKQKPSQDDSGAEPQVYHRYYHLFEETELERDIKAAGGFVLDSGYDRDNWWAIAAR
ncbi:tRNA (carboxymethyluridine(34)-5-O)-methyltransferase [Aspergillus affinis]|uniref:tRNA (carboxymethyluridine(34)-5-O)-methyltransferase n=1 Tax=Aspergillus affinis TaxID=1070780 RepID=UPI0022FE416E|nr:S-adenosyl-L-methionine-dependent methyltransferase [Aspergillus affinis]KAI9041532.1 S-adenosyl-L-methionine-dependent methyltransferase [Aspergillus affinis]